MIALFEHLNNRSHIVSDSAMPMNLHNGQRMHQGRKFGPWMVGKFLAGTRSGPRWYPMLNYRRTHQYMPIDHIDPRHNLPILRGCLDNRLLNQQSRHHRYRQSGACRRNYGLHLRQSPALYMRYDHHRKMSIGKGWEVGQLYYQTRQTEHPSSAMSHRIIVHK